MTHGIILFRISVADAMLYNVNLIHKDSKTSIKSLKVKRGRTLKSKRAAHVRLTAVAVSNKLSRAMQ